MDGNNYVKLVGFLKYPQLRETRNGFAQYQAKVAVPFVYRDRETQEEKQGHKYIKISAWRDLAQQLGDLPEDTLVTVHGQYNERSYDGNCKHCGTVEKKYWTDVLVDNFVVMDR
jgi:single-stranded DNA-binding protein